MQRKDWGLSARVSTALMPGEETISSYTGLTREQKREILTHSLVGGQQSALLRRDAERTE